MFANCRVWCNTESRPVQYNVIKSEGEVPLKSWCNITFDSLLVNTTQCNFGSSSSMPRPRGIKYSDRRVMGNSLWNLIKLLNPSESYTYPMP